MVHPNPSEADTHLRIIDAALFEFRQHGYKGSSTRSIAERAGVNEVTLFRHFGNKLDLLREAVAHALRDMHVPQSPDEYLALPLHEGLQRFLRAYAEQIQTQGDILMLGVAEAFSHPQIAELLRLFVWKTRAVLTEYFEEMVRQGRMAPSDLPVLTHTVLTTLHGTSALRRKAPHEMTKHLTDERVVDGLVDMIVAAYGREAD
jgi:AcrR family transcriptional regulator